MESIKKVSKVMLGAAKCALDLGDGSERGEYVSQDYILRKLGRKHRNIGLMYTYYPYDKEWPQRISVACKDMEIHFQWDYPYDDYFPYTGATGVPTNEPVFEQMRDVRRHGQDVSLTLTIDCKCDDEKLINIAKELKYFGRMKLRINHECAGDWFTHNQRYSFKEIGDFFVRFHKILKEYAPNVTTIFDTGFLRPDGTLENEEDFMAAYLAADEWSADCYLSLHYGWPFDVCEKDSKTYSSKPSVDSMIDLINKTADRYREINNGELKPLAMCEFNNDGDVTGPEMQGESVVRLAKGLAEGDYGNLAAFTMYQFRDRGRLGLELEDPNNSSVGVEQPILKDYVEIMDMDFFKPSIEETEEISVGDDFKVDKKLRWGGAEDAEGIALQVQLEKHPVFFEVNFSDEDKDLNAMLEINGQWFYKAPGVTSIEVMPAFYGKKTAENSIVNLNIFTPPASGENENIETEDGLLNTYSTLHKIPDLRIRYEGFVNIG